MAAARRVPAERPVGTVAGPRFGFGPRLGSGRARSIRLLVGRHRRTLSAAVLVLACWVAVRAAAPPRPVTVGVLVAAHDLPAGTLIAAGDERRSGWLAQSAPQGVLPEAAGQVLGAPMRAGEAFTSARVLGRGLLAGQPAGSVAFPVRVGDAQTTSLVSPGDRVDVLSATNDTTSAQPGSDEGAGRASRVVSGATVLALGTGEGVDDGGGADSSGGWSGGSGSGSGGGLGGLSGLTGAADGGSGASASDAGGLLVLAVTSGEAAELASAQATGYLTIAILPRSGG